MQMNIHFFIMLIITCVVFLSDIFIYLFNLNYYIAIAISFAVAIAMCIYRRKNLKIVSNFEKLDLVLIILLFIKMLGSITIPDNSYDVNMYHIYLQENPFIDKIYFDFFARKKFK